MRSFIPNSISNDFIGQEYAAIEFNYTHLVAYICVLRGLV